MNTNVPVSVIEPTRAVLITARVTWAVQVGVAMVVRINCANVANQNLTSITLSAKSTLKSTLICALTSAITIFCAMLFAS